MPERSDLARGARRRLGGLITVTELPLLVLIVVLFIVFGVGAGGFFTVLNWQDMGREYFVEPAFLALAEALVLLTRGIDLSVAATLSLSAVVLGEVVQHGGNVWLGVALALIVGVVGGAVNGCLIVYVRLTPIVATLTTLTLYRGLSLGISGGNDLTGYPTSFLGLGVNTFLGVPIQVWILLIVLLFVGLILARTIIGRWVYALGGSPRGARYAALPVVRTTIGVYAASGLLSAMAAVIEVARLSDARADFSTGAELNAVTAAILGGISIFGGRGRVFFAVVGALVIAMLESGLNLMNQSGFIQTIAIGVVLLLAITCDRLLRERQERTQAKRQLDRAPPEDEPAAAVLPHEANTT
jgi:ribose/xylose/arabinose/galactoside ABC-type transport system permease subunit